MNGAYSSRTINPNRKRPSPAANQGRPLSSLTVGSGQAGGGVALDDATGRSVSAHPLTTATHAIVPAHDDDGPHDAVLHAIHRGPSGYIPLAVKDGGREWRELGAVAVGQPFLPHVLQALARDGYFGVNTSYRTGQRLVQRERWTPIAGMQPIMGRGEGLAKALKQARRWHKDEGLAGPEELTLVWERQTENPDTGLPWQKHDSHTLRWLNAAYVDIDCYTKGLDVGAALGAIISLQDAGKIPPASMFIRSGRGLWALWLLQDVKNPANGAAVIHGQRHEPQTPQRASARALALYGRVQHAIVERLAHLGADLCGVDGPRYAPMPGTIKTTGTDRVMYWAQATAAGVRPVYTLTALAEQLGLELRTREHPIVEAAISAEPNETKAAAGRKGWKQRWLYALADLEMLLRLRGGTFNAPAVSRNVAAFLYAVILTRCGMKPADVDARVTALGQRSGLEPHETLAALRQARKKQPGRNHLLSSARWLTDLRVTDNERTYLRDRTPPAATGNNADVGTRRAAILEVIAGNGGRVPSVRLMAAHLQAAGVPCGNHTTVWRDYQALGLQPSGRAGRPQKLPL